MTSETKTDETEGQPVEHWKMIGGTESGQSLWIRSPERAWRKVDLSHFRKRRAGPNAGSKCGGAKLTEADIPVIRKLYGEGKTCREIGVIYSVGKNTIQHIIKRETWKHVEDDGTGTARPYRVAAPRGEKHPGSKLDESSVRKIRADYRSGKLARKIALELSVSEYTVRSIINNTAWKHVREFDEKVVVSVRRRKGQPKLDEGKVKEIRATRRDGTPVKILAEKFSVSKSAIKAIVSRRAWKHVD